MTAWPMADQWLGRARECVAGEDTNMHPLEARVYHGSPDAGDLLVLPPVDGIRIGSTLIVLNDSGANDWEVEQPDGTAVATVGPGEAIELRLFAINEPAEGYEVSFGSWTVTTHTVGAPS